MFSNIVRGQKSTGTLENLAPAYNIYPITQENHTCSRNQIHPPMTMPPWHFSIFFIGSPYQRKRQWPRHCPYHLSCPIDRLLSTQFQIINTSRISKSLIRQIHNKVNQNSASIASTISRIGTSYISKSDIVNRYSTPVNVAWGRSINIGKSDIGKSTSVPYSSKLAGMTSTSVNPTSVINIGTLLL